MSASLSLPLSLSVADEASFVSVFWACSRAASLPRGRRMASSSESELADMARADLGEAEGESRLGDDAWEDMMVRQLRDVGGVDVVLNVSPESLPPRMGWNRV